MPPNERWFGLNPFNPEEAFKTSISSEEVDEDEHGGGEPEKPNDSAVKKRLKVFDRTPETVVEELRVAFAKWKSLPEKKRGKFNIRWLQQNNFSAIYIWANKHGGIDSYIKLAGGDIERNFEKAVYINDRTPESAVKELRAAYANWKSLPEAERSQFSPSWLESKFRRLFAWMQSHGGYMSYIKLAGGEVEKDFKSLTIDRTPESAVKELRAAHAKWKALPEEERGRFNSSWLRVNYLSLHSWMYKNGGVMPYIRSAGKGVERDFEIRELVRDRTPESAVKELRAAHAKWKALPEEERGKFNPLWLKKYGYGKLIPWIRERGELNLYIKLAGDEFEKDFEIMEQVRDRTPESAVKELRAAHAKWKALPEEERGKFNPSWLFKNFSGFSVWMMANGGIEAFIELAGDEVEKDFERRGVSQYEKLKGRFEDFAKEVSEGETEISKYFRSLLNAFGASHCVDILYKFRPEYRAIHPEDVKGTIAEYLGDYLVAKRPFTADDAENAIEHLSDLTLREGLVQTMKEDCYRFVVAALRHRNGRDSKALVEAYRDHVREKIGHLAHPVFAEVVDEVINYYQDLWVTYERPENVVGSLSEQREFPDINQRMNMKELAEKKRLLIADEMGLGKSASAILAKEKLGIKSALVVAPSNVIQTWKRYLSEESEGGYFKQGSAPRVCVLESPQQLENLQQGAFDYYLLSHERLNPRYVRKVKGLNPDMLIVDEVHKLKELKGSRSQQLVELSEGVGEDGHVALLSGTPVPNKIEDIAVTLRVLYPDRFRSTTDRELVSSIIYSDLVDLRALLVPRMQMKGLEESLDMPELHEEEREIELSELEKEVYEILLEDDELFPNEKIKILRQFLLNPHLVDSTPGITGCKVEALSESLNSAFKESDKIVVFVNDYIEGVIRGEGNIIQELGIPQDVEVKVIHQYVPKVERAAIERSLKASGGKLLLLVSGQTADVGVDYSAADRIFFYNEPWTEYQKRQELGRVYRPGLAHDLESDTFIAKGTIEDGMHQYIERKYLAVEKLLRGIPVTDLEKSLLRQDERSSEPDLSVNPELAEYYFSSWDKLMKIFGYVKEIGERNFRQFLEKYGGDYAEAYRVLGNRSYQSNANRVTATVLEKIAEKSGQDPASIRILDIASGPEMLKRHIGETYQERVTSMDMNPEHFKDLTGKNNVVGSWLDMPFPEKTFDYLNLCLSLHYTNFAPSKGMYERLQVFQEMNRVLKVGGKAVLNLIYSYPPKDFQKFKDAIHELGFSIVEDYTGEASSGDRYHSHLVTLEKIKDLDPSISAEELSDLLGKERRDGLKFRETKEKLRRSRQVITKLALNGKEIDLKLNAKDREVLDEEQKLLAEAEALKKKHGSIRRIPASEIIEHGFVRVLSGSKYVLFKKLEKGSGAVVIRD